MQTDFNLRDLVPAVGDINANAVARYLLQRGQTKPGVLRATDVLVARDIRNALHPQIYTEAGAVRLYQEFVDAWGRLRAAVSQA